MFINQKKNGKENFEPRATRGILVGFEKGNAYRIFIPEEKRIIISQDVKINESMNIESIKSRHENMIEFDLDDTDTIFDDMNK